MNEYNLSQITIVIWTILGFVIGFTIRNNTIKKNKRLGDIK
jgi:hypothetical protein